MDKIMKLFKFYQVFSGFNQIIIRLALIWVPFKDYCLNNSDIICKK